jgi:uncharacterized protein involved in tolerance to divalent cations
MKIFSGKLFATELEAILRSVNAQSIYMWKNHLIE